MSFRLVNVPLYGMKIRLVTTRDEATALVEQISGGMDDGGSFDEFAGCCYPVTTPQGQVGFILAVFDDNRNTAIHESIHMARMILEHVQVRWSPKLDEPLAYLAAWIADEMLTFLEEVRDGEEG